jgi:hypothetical protein
MISQAFGEESMSRSLKFQIHRGRKRRERWKVKSMLINLFDMKRIVHKEFVLVGKTVRSTCYCDILRRLRENVRRLRPGLLQQKNWLLLHHNKAPSHTSFFTRKFFIKDNMTVVPHQPYFSPLPRLKIKFERPPFWHNWGDQGRIACCAEHTHRTRLPGCI